MTTHHFNPTQYYTAIGTYEPVLRIADGDSVITTTVDARGFDVNNQQVARRGNPMTGPFFIAGAEPGDTLAVHLDSITPNRTYGWSSTMVAPNVVDPEFVPHLPWPKDDTWKNAEWLVDVQTNNATLLKPETALGRFVVPLRPMIGCFGVAPARGEAISTATSAAHGGNMDYNGFGAGVTVYFPVFNPGALFFLGDAHAVQGDGEIAGTGIEISCDVQFTVRVVKGQKSNWPRGENAEYIFTLGNARPLDQCVQHATTEMLRWLTDTGVGGHGLDPVAASTLLGQCVEYELGNMFDPAYTMVCKLKKKWLRKG